MIERGSFEVSGTLTAYFDNATLLSDWLAKKAPLMSPELLDIIDTTIEEFAEVIKERSKVRRFGDYSTKPGETITTRERLRNELLDVAVMMNLIKAAGFIDDAMVADHTPEKIRRLRKNDPGMFRILPPVLADEFRVRADGVEVPARDKPWFPDPRMVRDELARKLPDILDRKAGRPVCIIWPDEDWGVFGERDLAEAATDEPGVRSYSIPDTWLL